MHLLSTIFLLILVYIELENKNTMDALWGHRDEAAGDGRRCRCRSGIIFLIFSIIIINNIMGLFNVHTIQYYYHIFIFSIYR